MDASPRPPWGPLGICCFILVCNLLLAKLFIQSVQCPSCGQANDYDFQFSQKFGYSRRILTPATVCNQPVDLKTIDAQLKQLFDHGQATSYSRQKDALKKELESFLSALPGHVTLTTATPRDVCRFLVYKDRHGRTQIHCNNCEFLGQRGKHQCGCPLRLAYTTVDSYIGKLRAIFQSVGRDGEWDRRLSLGNPAAAQLVKLYLRLVTAEQLQAQVTPKQATPFFVSKLTQLAEHLQTALNTVKTNLDCFILTRDYAYFTTTFFSGDRPGDLGQLKVPGILRFPNDDGFLFNHVWGKTLRDGDHNVFGICRNPHTVICPI